MLQNTITIITSFTLKNSLKKIITLKNNHFIKIIILTKKFFQAMSLTSNFLVQLSKEKMLKFSTLLNN